ncbi:GNAT family N-acetyltransferase [Planococcus sp. YIM B11945]|uniref:GNAT family N-acetyltransferase n=1 Tax=Planococcus sp. YIM B11945 TaxID=3435410 RepID=UPI003D7D44F0
MNLQLAPVTRENWEQALALQVKEAQRHFTPAVAVSLAKVFIKPDGDQVTYVPYAICDGDEMVGFIMHAYEKGTSDMYWINGFLIDEKHQGQGYGKASMALMMRSITEHFSECREIRLTVHTDNLVARKLYTDIGFQPAGEFFGEHEEVFVFQV